MHVARGGNDSGVLNQSWDTWQMVEAMMWLKTLEFKIGFSYECAM